MDRRKAIGSVMIGAAAAVSVRVVRAADKQIEVFTEHWRKSKDLTLKVTEAMPAENYDCKPFADARSFGGELQHLAQAEGFYLGQLGKGRGPQAPRGDSSKDATVKYLGASFDWAIGVVGQLTTEDLTKSFPLGRGASVTGLAARVQKPAYSPATHTKARPERGAQAESGMRASKAGLRRYFLNPACQFNTTVMAAPPACAGVAMRNRWPSFETS